MNDKRPRLSIGMIFKNDIRSLERCLAALEPLRKAVSCELVMADTGSTDGSRAIAERYADVLFDFTWVNDFSAARNAVMDRCSGVWYLTVDSDEYLDPDITELKRHLNTAKSHSPTYGYVIQRNYRTLEMKAGDYTDFLALRLVRLDTGSRYEGTIHERFSTVANATANNLSHTVFHHDGYAVDDMEKVVEKQTRNLNLLRQELEKHPDDPTRLLQCIESSFYVPNERRRYIFQAVELLKLHPEKSDRFRFGYSHLYRYSARDFLSWNLPEAESWLAWGEAHMADTISFRVDVCYNAAFYYHQKEQYPSALAWAERYEAGCADYDAGRYDIQELCVSPLHSSIHSSRVAVRLIRCECLLQLDRQTEGMELLERLDPEQLPPEPLALRWYLRLLSLATEFPERAQALCARCLTPLWMQTDESLSDQQREKKKKLQEACLSLADNLFHDGTWTIFLQTPGSLGIAARSMDIWAPDTVAAILGEVEHWSQVPAETLAHTIRCGAALPASFYRQDEKKLRTIAVALGKETELIPCLPHWMARENFAGSLPRSQFLFQLLSAFLRGADWESGEGSDALCALFSKVSGGYLPALYNPAVLAEEGHWVVLPGLHRFALYLSRANAAFSQGDNLGYVRALKAALEAAPAMKHMVDYLLKQLEERQRQNASPELLELAAKVRTILAQYPPDDPAVAALKQSEVYQKVAYLIEGLDAPVFGGLAQ